MLYMLPDVVQHVKGETSMVGTDVSKTLSKFRVWRYYQLWYREEGGGSNWHLTYVVQHDKMAFICNTSEMSELRP